MIIPVFGPQMSEHNNNPGICQELFKVKMFGIKSNLGSKIAEGINPPTIIAIKLARAPLQMISPFTKGFLIMPS